MHDGQRRPEIVTAWLAWRQLGGPSPRTVRDYGQTLCRLNDWLASEYGTQLLNATQGHLIAWRESLIVCDNSVATYMSAIRAFYSWARRQGLLIVDPAEDIPVPRRRRGIPRPAAEDDVVRAIAAAPRRIKPWLGLARYQGWRCQGIAYLERDHILDTRRPRQIYLGPAGSKGGTPHLFPMGDEVWRLLVEYGLPRRGYVFRRFDGRPGPNTPARISALANDYLRSISLDITIHQLRHTFATAALEGTGNILAVKEILGHGSVSSTEVYTLLSDPAAVAAVQAAQPKRRLHVVRDES